MCHSTASFAPSTAGTSTLPSPTATIASSSCTDRPSRAAAARGNRDPSPARRGRRHRSAPSRCPPRARRAGRAPRRTRRRPSGRRPGRTRTSGCGTRASSRATRRRRRRALRRDARRCTDSASVNFSGGRNGTTMYGAPIAAASSAMRSRSSPSTRPWVCVLDTRIPRSSTTERNSAAADRRSGRLDARHSRSPPHARARRACPSRCVREACTAGSRSVSPPGPLSESGGNGIALGSRHARRASLFCRATTMLPIDTSTSGASCEVSSTASCVRARPRPTRRASSPPMCSSPAASRATSACRSRRSTAARGPTTSPTSCSSRSSDASTRPSRSPSRRTRRSSATCCTTSAPRTRRSGGYVRSPPGRNIGAFALTEPGAGLRRGRDADHRAKPDGDDYVINGSKMFITNAGTDISLLAIATARTADGQISAFIVPVGTPGLRDRTSPPQDRLACVRHARARVHRLPRTGEPTCSASRARASTSSSRSSTTDGSRSRRSPSASRRAASTRA